MVTARTVVVTSALSALIACSTEITIGVEPNLEDLDWDDCGRASDPSQCDEGCEVLYWVELDGQPSRPLGCFAAGSTCEEETCNAAQRCAVFDVASCQGSGCAARRNVCWPTYAEAERQFKIAKGHAR